MSSPRAATFSPPVDEAVVLTEDEERGLIVALESARKTVLAHDDVMTRARSILGR